MINNLISKQYGLQYIAIMCIRNFKNGYRSTKPPTMNIFNRKIEMAKAKNIIEIYRKEKKKC